MPLFFVILGLVLFDSGVRGNARPLFAQVADDVKGFIAFAAVVMILWGAGISPTIRPVSKAMLVLVFVVYFLKNGHAIIDGIDQAASTSTNNQQSPQGNDSLNSTTGIAAPSSDLGSISGILNSIASSGNVNATAAGELQSGAQDLAQGYDSSVVNMVQHAPASSGNNSTQQAIQTGIAVAGIAMMLL